MFETTHEMAEWPEGMEEITGFGVRIVSQPLTAGRKALK